MKQSPTTMEMRIMDDYYFQFESKFYRALANARCLLAYVLNEVSIMWMDMKINVKEWLKYGKTKSKKNKEQRYE
jgi:hypothetical protein